MNFKQKTHECSLLLKFGNGTSFSKAQESPFSTSIMVDNSLPLNVSHRLEFGNISGKH